MLKMRQLCAWAERDDPNSEAEPLEHGSGHQFLLYMTFDHLQEKLSQVSGTSARHSGVERSERRMQHVGSQLARGRRHL